MKVFKMKEKLSLRSQVLPEDAEAVRQIVESTGFFYPYEAAVAVELVNERLEKGQASGYEFLFAEERGETVGYACYGATPCTQGSYDLYWIAVHQKRRGRGVGKRLLTACEERIRAQSGRRIYIETSSRPLYEPTRAFYFACGYRLEATLEDFYAPGDSKCIFVKKLS